MILCPLCHKHSKLDRREAHFKYLNTTRRANNSLPTLLMTTSLSPASSFLPEDDYTKHNTPWALQNHGYYATIAQEDRQGSILEFKELDMGLLIVCDVQACQIDKKKAIPFS